MIIAIASGKGGTGKTTLAVNLAHCAPGPVQLLDCDVEAPNAALFLKPAIKRSEPVTAMVPVVDAAKCTVCGKCAGVCEYRALAYLGAAPIVFPELCHGCLGCVLICPEGAITEGKREVGLLETGQADGVAFAHGRLNIGESLSPPLIRAVKREARADCTVIVDCPPGTSCPAVEGIRGADHVLLVAEPTPFGLNDLGLAIEMARAIGTPFGVVINRAIDGSNAGRDFCSRHGAPVLLEIPEERAVAEIISRGGLVTDEMPGFRETMQRVWREIENEMAARKAF